MKHAVKILKKKSCTYEGKVPVGPRIKWDDTDHVKIYERDPPEPTLVDTIKERRKKSKGIFACRHSLNYLPSFIFHYLDRLVKSLV